MRLLRLPILMTVALTLNLSAFAGTGPRRTDIALETIAALGAGLEVAGGVAMLATRVGLPMGATLAGKGVADLAVHVRNIGRAARGEEIIARSALGEITHRVTGSASAARVADVADVFLTLNAGDVALRRIVAAKNATSARIPTHLFFGDRATREATSYGRRFVTLHRLAKAQRYGVHLGTAGWVSRMPTAIASGLTVSGTAISAINGD